MSDLYNIDGPNTLTGTADRDTVFNTTPAHFLEKYSDRGGNDNDTISMGDGNDFMEVGPGTDAIDGGAGTLDTLELSSFIGFKDPDDGDGFPVEFTAYSFGFVVDLQAGTFNGKWKEYSNFDDYTAGKGQILASSGGTIAGFEVIYDSFGDDTILGSDFEIVFISGRRLGEFFSISHGQDYIDGRDGWDRLRVGYDGTAFGHFDFDFVVVDTDAGTWTGIDGKVSTFKNFEQFELSAGPDIFIGGKQADWVIPGTGADKLTGGPGKKTVDVLDFINSATFDPITSALSGVAASVQTGRATLGNGDRQTFSGFEKIIGSRGDDRISGGDGADDIDGGTGMDTLSGGGGKDTLYGSSDKDTIRGEGGNDRLGGGEGDDTLDGGDGFDWADYSLEFGTLGVDVSLRTGGTDTYGTQDTFRNIENLRGSALDDMLRGDDGDNQLEGGDGIDTLRGGDGNDRLNGGKGADKLTGGSGADIFVFAVDDLSGKLGDLDDITDFEPGTDSLLFL